MLRLLREGSASGGAENTLLLISQYREHEKLFRNVNCKKKNVWELITASIHPCHTAAILDILGMKSRRCVANLRFAAINHAKQRFQCALMCTCAQITDQKVK